MEIFHILHITDILLNDDCMYVLLFVICNVYSPPSSDAASIPPSSIPSSVNQSRGFSNLCQLFAWSV